jgi:hypothetical protein
MAAEESRKNPAEAQITHSWKIPALGRLGIYFLLASAAAVLAVKLGFDGTVMNAERWSGGGSAFLGGGGGGGKSQMLSETINSTSPTSVRAALHDLALAAATALIWAIPISVTYSLTRRREGYDRSIVQMLIILPVLVAGIVLVVQGSLALAFILGGIVAVVRFRATFRDVKDAVFGFCALCIGLAAGIHSIVIAAGISLIFCSLAIVLWKMEVGDIRRDLSRIEGDAKLSDHLVPMETGEVMERGESNGSDLNGHTQLLEEEAGRLERIIQSDTEGKKKKSRFTHLLLVHTNKAKSTRDTVESLLESSAKRWRFVSELPYSNGTRTLEFLARLRSSANESRLLSSIQHEKEVIGVELKAVGALRESVAAS